MGTFGVLYQNYDERTYCTPAMCGEKQSSHGCLWGHLESSTKIMMGGRIVRQLCVGRNRVVMGVYGDIWSLVLKL